jgi:hypothetical protein
MNRIKLNEIFTNKVIEWLSKGYIIRTDNMSGSQGEEAKIHLYKGKQGICIYMNKHYNNGNDLMEIIIGEFDANKNQTVWLHNLKEIEKITYYKIGRYSEFYGTKEEAQKAYEIFEKRYTTKENANYKEIELSNKAKEIILPLIKRQPKCKSVKLSDIEYVKKVIKKDIHEKVQVGYFAKVKGKIIIIK